MARPQKKGLSYFPFDVEFFQDDKIRKLHRATGSKGIEFYLRILCECYRDNGYFYNWDKDEDYEEYADRLSHIGNCCSPETIHLILNTCFKRSLFNKTLFDSGNVLTSRSIQQRYFSAIKETKKKAAALGRYTVIKKDICLLNSDDISELNETGIWLKVIQNPDNSTNNYDNSTNNYDNSEINDTKERKGNESILEYIKEEYPSENPNSFSSFLKTIENFLSKGMTSDCVIEIIGYCKKRKNKKSVAYAIKTIGNSFDNGIRTKQDFIIHNPVIKPEEKKGPLNNFDQPMPDFEKIMDDRIKRQQEG